MAKKARDKPCRFRSLLAAIRDVLSRARRALTFGDICERLVRRGFRDYSWVVAGKLRHLRNLGELLCSPKLFTRPSLAHS